MTVAVHRTGTTVTVVVGGDDKTTRSETCRSAQCAVALEAKLVVDQVFAGRSVCDREAILPVSIPSPDERKHAAGR
ncbi:MAG: hypothetical protein WCJ64_22145 [Rhodospirillaceae bacterium]